MSRLIGSALLVLFAFSLAAHGQNPLVGAWKVTEATPVNAPKITQPQPGLYIFTPKHYSIMTVTGTKPRPKYAARDQASDADIIATFDAFTANSGTYTVTGNTLKTRPIVAKNEFVMTGAGGQYEFSVNGNTLTLTAKPAGGGPGAVTKLTRLE